MVPCRLEFVEPQRRKVKIATDGTRDRLCLVVIVKAGEVAPARIAAQFDQTRADHDAKPKPSKKPNNENRWGTLGKRSSIEQRTKKDRQEASFEQLNLPPITVPNLSNMDNGHVHRPKHREQNRVGVAAQNDQRQGKAHPGEDRQCIVGNSEPKKRRESRHSSSARTELCLDALKKMTSRR